MPEKAAKILGGGNRAKPVTFLIVMFFSRAPNDCNPLPQYSNQKNKLYKNNLQHHPHQDCYRLTFILEEISKITDTDLDLDAKFN